MRCGAGLCSARRTKVSSPACSPQAAAIRSATSGSLRCASSPALQRPRFTQSVWINPSTNRTMAEEAPHGGLGRYPRSFLALLGATVTPDDFVVVKVDIDGGPEVEIVRAIAHTPWLARLVDELFFEFHFDFDQIEFGWYGIGKQHSVDDALQLMHSLRKVGIRSHFWI